MKMTKKEIPVWLEMRAEAVKERIRHFREFVKPLTEKRGGTAVAALSSLRYALLCGPVPPAQPTGGFQSMGEGRAVARRLGCVDGNESVSGIYVASLPGAL